MDLTFSIYKVLINLELRKGITHVQAEGAFPGLACCVFPVFSTSSTGGSPIKRLEERQELRKTVVKTLEEYTNDSSTPAEDEIVMIQVPRSKWEKEDFEFR